jgi:WD40 repeat protein
VKLFQHQNFNPNIDEEFVVNSSPNEKISDLKFSPFNPLLLAVASDEKLRIYLLSKNKKVKNETMVHLEGHKRKIRLVKFHPTADHTLITASMDNSVKLWDAEYAKDSMQIVLESTSESFDFNKNGSLFCLTTKDSNFHICDPRAAKIINLKNSKTEIKQYKCIWTPNYDKILTFGFSKNSSRECNIWDPRNMDGGPLKTESVDSNCTKSLPIYDEDSSVLFLSSKSDFQIRYYFFDGSDLVLNGVHKRLTCHEDMTMYPKYMVNTLRCESSRLLLFTKSQAIPLSYCVPRKVPGFHRDLYPDTRDIRSPMNHLEWKSGKDLDPIYMSMVPEFQNKEMLWISMKYHKKIRSVTKLEDLKFKFI